MTQQDLIQLIGLKSTDPQLLAHFEKQSLSRPPKNLTPNNGSKIIYDKERNLYYAFSFEVCNDLFYPPMDVGGKNPDYKFVAWLTEISFLYKEPSAGKPDPKDASFWNITPAPAASLKEIVNWFGIETDNQDDLFFEKTINELLVVKAWYNRKKGLLTSNWVSIIQNSELISHYHLQKDGDFAYEAHLHAMLIKWLYDNRYFVLDDQVYQNGLPMDTDTVLNWTKQHLNQHVWDNQITSEHLLRSFMFEIKGNSASLKNEVGERIDFNFIRLHLQLAGRLEAYKELNPGGEERKAILQDIAFNEANYVAFYEAMNEQFSRFKILSAKSRT